MTYLGNIIIMNLEYFSTFEKICQQKIKNNNILWVLLKNQQEYICPQIVFKGVV